MLAFFQLKAHEPSNRTRKTASKQILQASSHSLFQNNSTYISTSTCCAIITGKTNNFENGWGFFWVQFVRWYFLVFSEKRNCKAVWSHPESVHLKIVETRGDRGLTVREVPSCVAYFTWHMCFSQLTSSRFSPFCPFSIEPSETTKKGKKKKMFLYNFVYNVCFSWISGVDGCLKRMFFRF